MTRQGRRAIDAMECKNGEDASRPRLKFVDVAEMIAVTKS
jgi:hypothetical protein